MTLSLWVTMEVTVYLEVAMKSDYQGQVGMKSGVCVYYKFPEFKSKHSLSLLHMHSMTEGSFQILQDSKFNTCS